MSIESYGGNPDIVATREEIQRVSNELGLAAQQLGKLDGLLGLFEDPLSQLHYWNHAQQLIGKLESLQVRAQLVAESYFTTEAQIHRRFQISVVPELAGLLVRGLSWRLDRVEVDEIVHRVGSPPKTTTAILDSLWRLSVKDQTVAVETFSDDLGKIAIVYIPGTQTINFGSDANPLDMKSNIEAMAESGKAASERAVLMAMEQSGITLDYEVLFVGHSQGGMVAANLAHSPGNYRTLGLIAIGAPIAQLALRAFPVMAIEHTNDPIPNLSGRINPLTTNWLTIQRKAESSESSAILSSHALNSYKNTTKAIDQSSDSTIGRFREKLLGRIGRTGLGVYREFEIRRAK